MLFSALAAANGFAESTAVADVPSWGWEKKSGGPPPGASVMVTCAAVLASSGWCRRQPRNERKAAARDSIRGILSESVLGRRAPLLASTHVEHGSPGAFPCIRTALEYARLLRACSASLRHVDCLPISLSRRNRAVRRACTLNGCDASTARYSEVPTRRRTSYLSLCMENSPRWTRRRGRVPTPTSAVN